MFIYLGERNKPELPDLSTSIHTAYWGFKSNNNSTQCYIEVAGVEQAAPLFADDA